MLFDNEDGSIYDPFAHLEAIGLIPRLSCIMKVRLYQINVKNSFLNLDASLDSPTGINNMECVNMRDCEDLVIDTMLGRMAMEYVQQMLIEFELSMIKYVSYLPNFQVK